ncbi:MAG: hypothetical protein IKP69_09145 [Oscillospiraceae bacterium]|nr:hypothetical protein [Oscillospiraceae bacterium]
MNMKRIVFFGAAILVMVIIIAWVLHSMTHIDEINQERREKEKGAALASQMVITTETTSIWDVLRSTETTGVSGENNPENQQNPEEQPATAPEGEIFPEDSLPEENAPIPQTFTETVEEQP